LIPVQRGFKRCSIKIEKGCRLWDSNIREMGKKANRKEHLTSEPSRWCDTKLWMIPSSITVWTLKFNFTSPGHVEQHSQFDCISFCGSWLPMVTRKERLEGLNIQAKIVARLVQSFCDSYIFHGPCTSFFFAGPGCIFLAHVDISVWCQWIWRIFFPIHKIALNLGNVSTMSDFAVCWTPRAKLGNICGVITVKLSAQWFASQALSTEKLRWKGRRAALNDTIKMCSCDVDTCTCGCFPESHLDPHSSYVTKSIPQV
jgi:hypothetical protein